MSASIVASAPAVLLLAEAAIFAVCFAASRWMASLVASLRNWLTVTDRLAAVAAALAVNSSWQIAEEARLKLEKFGYKTGEII